MVYISLVVVMIGLSIVVRVYRHRATRTCHQCGARVELGKGRCQICDYQFIN